MWPPGRFQDRLGGAGWRAQPGARLRARQLWDRGNGAPLRRDPDDRLGGGMAAGIAAWRGFSPTTVRIACVVAALVSQGWAVPIYFIGWLLIPVRTGPPPAATTKAPGPGPAASTRPAATSGPAATTGPRPAATAGPRPAVAAECAEPSIGARARHDTRGIALAVALGSLLAVFLLLSGVLNDGAIELYGWPQVVSVFCLTLIWRNAPEPERATIRHLVEPLESLWGGGGRMRRGTALRFAASGILLVAGLSWLLSLHGGTALLAPLGGFVLVAAAIVLLLGPWWLKIARDLVFERQARARAEERADMAARVHDSVLQTLALIQRRADDPAAVVQLARAQERELRSWLFEGRAPGDTDVTSLAEGVRRIQREVEARHGVPVEVVTVGDCPLDEHVSALLAAAGEATVNAAKWSGADVISVYAEVEPDKVAVAVRDRGRGFDPAAVPADRKGVAESIRGRMARHGGDAVVQSAPGEGTKVTLTLPRTAGPVPPAPGPRR
jgi:phage shock protein PspC (stress-responsive transcriptional regulator)